MKDPFEAAVEEQESPPESPLPPEEDAGAGAGAAAGDGDEDEIDAASQLPAPSSAAPPLSSYAAAAAAGGGGGRGREDEDEDEEENMEVELDKIPSGGDPDKLAKMQKILSKFSEEQMSRYESFRRSGFQKANMRRFLGELMNDELGGHEHITYKAINKHYGESKNFCANNYRCVRNSKIVCWRAY